MDFVKKFVILSFFPLLFSLVASAEQLTFTRNLKIGMIGEDVRQLQIFLNKDNDTKVANTGIGSPGQESTYFGALTQKAVIRYQEKNRESILKPNGLSSGTGFVGPSTIGLLNKMPITESEVQKTTKVTAMATTTSAVSPVSPKVVGSGPNYENITTFVSSIEKIAKQNGFSEDKIALMKEEIYKGVATTTDLKSAFMKIVQEKIKKTTRSDSDTSLFAVQLEKIVNKFITTLYPKRVSAATGVPFGGAITFAFPCSCSNTWLIDIVEPVDPPPNFRITILDYIQGSQAYLSYNIPFTNWLLGEYIPGAGVCMTGYFCTQLPAQGMISPMVGSSLE